MNIVKGRDNLSVTVFVPVDCENNCKFCTSKKLYDDGVNIEKVKAQLLRVKYSDIKEVVITGGEPTQDLGLLKELVNIVSNKDVYINTSLPETNAYEFVEYVNNTPCIKGVNISRHCATFGEDSRVLKNLASDVYIKFIKKPVRINVVITHNLDLGYITLILDRWHNVNNNIIVNFRADYRNMTIEKLFNTDGSISSSDPFLTDLFTLGEYIGRSYCSVCHTMRFKWTDNMIFQYHRGLELTSKTIGSNTLEINDIIISPNGKMLYDWDEKNTYIKEVREAFNMIDEVRAKPSIYNNKSSRWEEKPIGSCGYMVRSHSVCL